MSYSDVLYENFLRNFRFLKNKAIDYEPYTKYEIIVRLNTGERVLYDELNQTIEILRPIETEAAWRWQFANRLTKRIRLCGMLQDEVARKTGIARTTLSRYTNGRAVPTLYNAQKLAEVLNCTVNDLLDFPK